MKLNKKGFTLIEILAIVVLIGVVAVIAIPNVTKQADDHAAKQTKLLKEQILNAAKIAASSSVRVDDNGWITDDPSVKTNIEKLIGCKDETIGTECMKILIHTEDTEKVIHDKTIYRYFLVGNELLSLQDSALESYKDKYVRVKKVKKNINGTDKEIIEYVLP